MHVFARGVHTHPTKKLGFIPRDPQKPILRFAQHATAFAFAPVHPVSDVDAVITAQTWPMDRNDEAGDCVVASVDHALQAIHAQLGVPRQNWTDSQLLKYYQTQNPGFRSWADSGGPNDGGMIIQDFLAYLVKEGTILGFALVDHTDEEESKAATYLGLATVTGEDLQVAQQAQTTWDPVRRSPEWGGHATCNVAYMGSPDTFRQVSWGELLSMSWRFMSQQVSEQYFILIQAHVDNPSFRQSFNLASFAAAYTSLTGRPFPVTPQPTPVPPTPPTPPVADADRVLAQALRSWLTAKGL